MNREIRFRAWDLKAKIMRDDGTHPEGKPHMKYDVGILPKDAQHEWATGVDGLEIRVDSKDFILMQFTGRKDKNGKDIYDGDRVRRMKDGIEGEVFWKYDGWFVKVDGSIDARLHDWEHYCESIEVIGTIYDEI